MVGPAELPAERTAAFFKNGGVRTNAIHVQPPLDGGGGGGGGGGAAPLWRAREFRVRPPATVPEVSDAAGDRAAAAAQGATNVEEEVLQVAVTEAKGGA